MDWTDILNWLVTVAGCLAVLALFLEWRPWRRRRPLLPPPGRPLPPAPPPGHHPTDTCPYRRRPQTGAHRAP